MSDESSDEKPPADYSETDAVYVDDDGNRRLVMESLQKSGGSDDVLEQLIDERRA